MRKFTYALVVTFLVYFLAVPVAGQVYQIIYSLLPATLPTVGVPVPNIAAAIQQDPGANPSFPGEPPEYPAGHYCSPAGDIVEGLQTPDHPCGCKRVDRASDCETQHTTTNACAQYCHDNHCACPVKCEPAPPSAEPSEGNSDDPITRLVFPHGEPRLMTNFPTKHKGEMCRNAS